MYRIILRDTYKNSLENIDRMPIADFDERNMGLNGVNRNLSRNISLFYDNLKPVQRRVLYSMARLKMWSKTEPDSCSGVVGSTLKWYHPHGDQSCYGALIYMAQPWRQLITLVKINGGYGSAESPDMYAQMRYVKCKLSEFAEDCFFSEWDLKSSLVDMKPSYNGHDMEPLYLPAKYPLFLMNWGSGMGYGIATNSPGFLPQDAMNAVITLIDNPDAKFVLYPEDPLGCTIMNKEVFKKFVDYKPPKDETKNLTFKVRSTYSVKDNMIIIHNAPYEVSPLTVKQRIVSLVKENKIDGLYDMEIKPRRGSIPQLGNKEDTAEIIIELKRGYDPHIIMEKLYKLTGLEATFPLNCVYVDKNKNIKHNLRESILKWINMRRKILKRLYRIELNKYQKRLSVLKAIIMIFETNSIDKLIKIIKTNTRSQAKELIIEKFDVNDYQADQISGMRLSDLSTDAYDDYLKERAKTSNEIERLQDILEHKKNIDNIIKAQMEEGIKKYSRKRLSKVIESSNNEPDEDTSYTICVSDTGYIKKLPVNVQEFGKVIEDSDMIAIDTQAMNTSKLIMFSNIGKVYGEFIYKLPESRADGVGFNMRKSNVINADLIGAVVVPPNDTGTIIGVTRLGYVKRSKADDYFSAASNSLGIRLGKDDSLVNILYTSTKSDKIVIYTKKGYCVLYGVEEINTTARATSGFSGIKLEPDDEVLGAKIVRASDTHMITISTKGELKKFSFETTLGSMRRGCPGLDVMSKNENLYNLVTVGAKDESITIITSKSLEGETLLISDIPTKTRISTGDKLLNVRRGKELIRVNKAQKK